MIHFIRRFISKGYLFFLQFNVCVCIHKSNIKKIYNAIITAKHTEIVLPNIVFHNKLGDIFDLI